MTDTGYQAVDFRGLVQQIQDNKDGLKYSLQSIDRLCEAIMAYHYPPSGGGIKSPKQAVDIMRKQICEVHKEHFIVLYLDARNKVIDLEVTAIGSLNSTIVHPREVFKRAIVTNSAAIILGHNHPSGDTKPSQEDLTLTARLVEAGRLLGIEVLDHLIFTSDCQHLSFRSENYIKEMS